MALKIVNGLDFDRDFIEDIYNLEYKIYGKNLCGKIENMRSRFEACKDSFLLLLDGEKIVGYINFFPVKKALYNQFIDTSDHRMRDDDITKKEIAGWKKGQKHDIFVISVLVDENHRADKKNASAISLIGDTFLEYLRQKENDGYLINSLTGYAVSPGGQRFLKRFRANYVKNTDNGYMCFSSCPENIKYILKNGLLVYKKTFKDDIYIFLPMSFDKASKKDYPKLKNRSNKCKFANEYRNCLSEHIEYECNTETFKKNQISRYYLGEFDFGCYDDDYDDALINNPNRVEKAHLFVTEHKTTGIYIVTLAIPDNSYSTSQIIDQMSTGNLRIRRNGKFVLVNDYLSHYGLYSCGEAKCVTCMSNLPENKTELPYILSGETMLSQHISYKITDKRMSEMITNHACYDYYDSYISSSVVAFVFNKNTWRDNVLERLSAEASVQFIIEIVLFQNTAVQRTNSHVIEAFNTDNKVSNDVIIELYKEFGKTMTFWSSNVFKYPYSQKEANEVINSFGIRETLNEYHRNQQFLDNYFQLVNDDANVKSDHIMNHTLFFLSCLEGCSLTLAAILWIVTLISGTTIKEIFSTDFPIRFIWIQICVAACIFIYTRIKKILDLKPNKNVKKAKKKAKK